MLKGLLGKIVRKVLLPIAEDVVRKEIEKRLGADLAAKAVAIDDLLDRARAKTSGG